MPTWPGGSSRSTRRRRLRQSLADALLVLEGKADKEDPTEVALRVGRSPRTADSCSTSAPTTARCVLIGPYGWEVAERSPVLLWRTNATLPIPSPNGGGELDDLRGLLNVRDEDWPLVLAWLVSA